VNVVVLILRKRGCCCCYNVWGRITMLELQWNGTF